MMAIRSCGRFWPRLSMPRFLANGDAVTDRFSARQNVIEITRVRIDQDRAGRFPAVIVDDVALYGSGIAAFSYGADASNFLSRGVRFASDAGSTVDCMQPPSTTAMPNRTTDNPLNRHLPSLSRSPHSGRTRCFHKALTEKTTRLPWFPACPQSPSCVLWQECRSATNRPARKMTLAPRA